MKGLGPGGTGPIVDRTVHWHLVVHGRVQGVNYRARVAEAAVRLGVVGTVANRTDGSVLIDAQGLEATLEEFVRDVSGPRGFSHPTSVRRVAELPPHPNLTGFAVVRD